MCFRPGLSPPPPGSPPRRPAGRALTAGVVGQAPPVHAHAVGRAERGVQLQARAHHVRPGHVAVVKDAALVVRPRGDHGVAQLEDPVAQGHPVVGQPCVHPPGPDLPGGRAGRPPAQPASRAPGHLAVVAVPHANPGQPHTGPHVPQVQFPPAALGAHGWPLVTCHQTGPPGSAPSTGLLVPSPLHPQNLTRSGSDRRRAQAGRGWPGSSAPLRGLSGEVHGRMAGQGWAPSSGWTSQSRRPPRPPRGGDTHPFGHWSTCLEGQRSARVRRPGRHSHARPPAARVPELHSAGWRRDLPGPLTSAQGPGTGSCWRGL